MRHAEAEPSRGRKDHARPLSHRGIREAEAAGRELAAEFAPDVALVSDSTRTRATFDRVSAAFANPPSVEFLRTLYGAAPGAILSALGGLPDRVATALVIGHNPGIGDLARALASTGDTDDIAGLRAHFPTACRAVLALEGTAWRAVMPGRLERLLGAKGG